MSKVEQKQAARSGGGIAMSCLDEQDKITIENEQVLPDGGHEHPMSITAITAITDRMRDMNITVIMAITAIIHTIFPQTDLQTAM